jgi:hypothetical protein
VSRSVVAGGARPGSSSGNAADTGGSADGGGPPHPPGSVPVSGVVGATTSGACDPTTSGTAQAAEVPPAVATRRADVNDGEVSGFTIGSPE